MKPYNRKDSTKSQEIREMFDNIAPKYDTLNHILSFRIDRLWRRGVVKLVADLCPSRVLDLATGTGDLAIAIARRVPTAEIIGIDPSSGMLNVAREKLKHEGLEHQIELRCGEAEELALDSESVDVVTVAFGVRNFEDIERGLQEMVRVVKCGGHVIILEFSRPDNPIFRWFYTLYSRHILPLIGGFVSRHRCAYDYLPASVEEFLPPAQLVKTMQSIGLCEVEVYPQSMGIARIYMAKKIEK